MRFLASRLDRGWLHLSNERLKRERFLRILHLIWGTEFLGIIFPNFFRKFSIIPVTLLN